MLVLKFLSPSTHFTKFVLGLVVIFGLLNALYFQSAWEYGVKYQGPEHTKIVAIENVVGFSLAMAIAVVALVKSSQSLALAAQLTAFCVVVLVCISIFMGASVVATHNKSINFAPSAPAFAVDSLGAPRIS